MGRGSGQVRNDSMAVNVEGLDEFRRLLRKGGKDVAAKVAAANFRIVDELVVKPARRRASGQPGATGKLANGTVIRAAKRAKAAVVVVGGRKTTEWVLGAEFGAKQYPQFQAWRGNQFTVAPGQVVGHVVHPTIAAQRARIENEYVDTVLDAVSPAFPD